MESGWLFKIEVLEHYVCINVCLDICLYFSGQINTLEWNDLVTQ